MQFLTGSLNRQIVELTLELTKEKEFQSIGKKLCLYLLRSFTNKKKAQGQKYTSGMRPKMLVLA